MTALTTATAGLRVTQSAIELVSTNVANAGTAGYIKRRLNPVETISGGQSSSVRSGQIERLLSDVAQRQLRLETSGAAYTSVQANVATQLGALYGTPGDSGSLDGTVNAFTQSLQALASDPSSSTVRAGVVTAAQTLARKLASISSGVQSLRTDAETRLSNDVGSASGLLGQIAKLNVQIASAGKGTGAEANLLDERDEAVNQLSQYVDVQTSQADDGSTTVRTGSGVTLVDHGNAATLKFDSRGSLSANSVYSTDPTKRSVGTITATLPGGTPIDLVGSGGVGSGSIAASLDLRDTTLTQAQRQLDDLAGNLSRALSDKSVTGTAAVSGSATGFDINLAGLQAGNAVTLDYTDSTGAARRYTLVPTNGAAPATIDPNQTADPGATVKTIDISGGPSTYAAKIGAALGSGFSVSDTPSATSGTIRILSGTASGSPVPTGVGAGITVTATNSGSPQLPLFVDTGYGNTPFTGSFEGLSHLTGLSGRLAVNPATIANTSTLSSYSASTLPGDATRPQYLYNSLTAANATFSAASGVGGIAAPYTTSVQDFAQKIVAVQGANAQNAQSLDEGQQVALSSAQSRFAGESGVNIDEEMAQLIQLQTAYGANARVLTAARDMLDTLLRI